MKRTTLKTRAISALLGMAALGASPASSAAADRAQSAGCAADVHVMPTGLANNSTPCEGECGRHNEWIKERANEYKLAVQQACQSNNALVSQMGDNNQQGSQKNAKANYTSAASSLGQVIEKGNTYKRDTAQKAKGILQNLQRGRSGAGGLQRASRMFNNVSQFETQVPPSPLENETPEIKSYNPAYQNSAEFIHKLFEDIKKREKTKQDFEQAAAKAGQNEENAGPPKKEDGKGMDPSALAGPLAALAGMANQKKADSAASDVSNPGAEAAPPPPETKLGTSVVKGTNLGSGSSKTGGGAAKVVETGKTAESGQDASQYASGLSTSSGPYKDAFTGFGANGTTPGTFSPSGGGASGGAGNSGAGENGERGTASSTHSPAEEEALSSFGGGGLNFAGGGGGSSSHSGGDEGVKDFLQDAESTLGDSPLGEYPEGELATAAEGGVEGEDGTELFRRVRSALERSQRKGAVLSGLSGPKDPRYR